MTTSASLETQWDTYVWSHEDIEEITEKVYFYAVTEDSEFELEKLFKDGELNFFQCLIARESLKEVTQRVRHKFTAEISYYRTKSEDPTGLNWTAVRDAFETLYDTVQSSLGESWNETVDYWEPQEGPPEIVEVQLGSEKVWRGSYRFFAYKEISL